MTELDIRCLENLVFAIHEFASFEFQKKVWQGKARWISCYTELICTLYDDCAFEDYFLKKSPIYLGYSIYLQSLFKEFNTEVCSFTSRTEPDMWEHIHNENYWNDFQWKKISWLAKLLLKEWNKEEKLVGITLTTIVKEEEEQGIYEDLSSYFN